MSTHTTPDGTSLPDDGRRYALTGPRGIDETLDNLSPAADHHTITVYGSADLARRLAAADQAGACVAFRHLDQSDADPGPAVTVDDDGDGDGDGDGF